MIATENTDGTLTITSCYGLKSRDTVKSTSDGPKPAFDAVVDSNWGLSASFLGITFGVGKNSEKDVVGVLLSEASVEPRDFMDDLTTRLSQCQITGNAYIVASASLYLITSKNIYDRPS
jgi:hypothetical protein